MLVLLFQPWAHYIMVAKHMLSVSLGVLVVFNCIGFDS